MQKELHETYTAFIVLQLRVDILDNFGLWEQGVDINVQAIKRSLFENFTGEQAELWWTMVHILFIGYREYLVFCQTFSNRFLDYLRTCWKTQVWNRILHNPWLQKEQHNAFYTFLLQTIDITPALEVSGFSEFTEFTAHHWTFSFLPPLK